MIYLLLQILGMRQLGSQVTIVCQQQYTCSIAVQTTYRINTFVACALHQIHHRATCLGIIRSSHCIFRLVQQDVNLTFDADRLVVELHFIATLNLGSQFRYHLSVYRNDSSSDEFISLATGANTGIGQEFVQADRLVRVHKLLLIFYLFLLAVLSIGVIIGRTTDWTAIAVSVAVSARSSTTRIEAWTIRTVTTLIIVARTLRTVAIFAVVARTIGTVRIIRTVAVVGAVAVIRTLRTVTTLIAITRALRTVTIIRALRTVATFAVIARTVRTVTRIVSIRALRTVAAFAVIARTIGTVAIIVIVTRTLRTVTIVRTRIKARAIRAVTVIRTLRAVPVFTVKSGAIRTVAIITVVRRTAVATFLVKLVTIAAGT